MVRKRTIFGGFCLHFYDFFLGHFRYDQRLTNACGISFRNLHTISASSYGAYFGVFSSPENDISPKTKIQRSVNRLFTKKNLAFS